jgi:hypothetical protein
VCTLGDWRGWLPGRVTGPALRVAAEPASTTDPAWIIGRAPEQGSNRPIFHPLPFAEVDPKWKPLFSAEAKP